MPFSQKTAILQFKRDSNYSGKIYMDEKEPLTFEEALKQLENTVQQLEDDEITLEASVQLYEKGVKLSKFCTEILEQAELRIEQVNEAIN